MQCRKPDPRLTYNIQTDPFLTRSANPKFKAGSHGKRSYARDSKLRDLAFIGLCEFPISAFTPNAKLRILSILWNQQNILHTWNMAARYAHKICWCDAFKHLLLVDRKTVEMTDILIIPRCLIIYSSQVLVIIVIASLVEGLLIQLFGDSKQWRLSVCMLNTLIGALSVVWNL